MKMIKVRIHSVVDAITNSSTTTYVMANDKTIEAFKDVINSLIVAGGGDKTADDLFTFSTECEGARNYREEHIGYTIHEQEFKNLKYGGEAWKKKLKKYYDKYETEQPDWWNDSEMASEEGYSLSPDDSEYGYATVNMIVKAKDDNPETVKIAEMLEGLVKSYDIEACGDY